MKQQIEFKILHKDREGLGVELPDKTIILIDKKNKGLRIAFPKSKFKEIFEKKQKNWKYYEVLFSDYEIEMLMKALDYKVKKPTFAKRKEHNRNLNQ